MGRTAYLFDRTYTEHKPGMGHPERPERLTAIHNRITKSDYYGDLLLVKAAVSDLKYIKMNHDSGYVDELKRKMSKGTGFLDADTGFSEKTYEAAVKAVGGSLRVCDAIMKGEAINGFCAVRPPGHHAEYDYASGFCIFNNVAIAARYLHSEYGLNRIAVIDWDVHHGNGTQHSFESDNWVYYISIHQNPLFPGTGAEKEKGFGKGLGFTLNIPMEPGRTDEDYIDVFNTIIVPELDRYRPEIILISAGFDAHHADPLASIMLSNEAFRAMTEILVQAAERHCAGKVISFLEGGYNLKVLADCVDEMMREFVKSSGVK